MAQKYDTKLEKTPPGFSKNKMNGGELDILGLVRVIVLGGDGKRRQISFICCDFPKGKEPLLNEKAMISLGILPQGYPSHDHLTGTLYDGNKVQMIFSDGEQFIKKLQTEEDEREYNEHRFLIKRAIN